MVVYSYYWDCLEMLRKAFITGILVILMRLLGVHYLVFLPLCNDVPVDVFLCMWVRTFQDADVLQQGLTLSARGRYDLLCGLPQRCGLVAPVR